MSRARNLADLLDSNGDVVSGALDNVPPSNDASALTTGTLPVERVPYVGRRNLIINGAMQVAQRGTVSITNTNSYGGPDRFMTWVNGTGATVDVSRSGNAPDEFAGSYRIETTTAGNYSTASSYQIWGQPFEGQDYQSLAFGTSSAKDVTASFWVRSSETGTVNLEFRVDGSPDMHNIAQYTINSANTWEYKTVTFSGNTTLSIPNTANRGGYLIHWGKSGSSYNTGTAPTNGWVNTSSTNFAAGATLDIISGVGRYLEFTGVQLEVGSVATPFEHRSYGEELALCQRYFINFGDLRLLAVGSRTADTGGIRAQSMLFPCAMRTQPSASYNDGYGNSAKVSMQPCDQNTETQTNLNLGLQYNYQGISGLISYNTNMGVSLCQVGIARLDDVTFDAEL